MKKVLISSALLGSALVFAGGFRVSLQGVRQLAQAHTSAHAEDASIAFFNPAGISFIPAKLSIAAGGFAAISEVTYQNPSTLESHHTNDPTGTPFYGAIAYKVTDKISVGFTTTTPFGSTVQWPSDWSGREIVQKLQLKAFFFEPMVSFKLAPWASFGVSYIHAKGSVNWDKAITQLNGSLNLDGDAKGDGFGFGFYLQPDHKWDVSVAYRSAVDMKANGTATFNVASSLFPTLLGSSNTSGKDTFTATLPLVEEYTLGATYKVSPKWSVSGDFNYSGWERYRKLVLDFGAAPVGNQASDPTVSVKRKDWHNTKTFRLGTQYLFNDRIAARIGYYYDESPYKDEQFAAETPSFDANVFTAGLGFKLNKFGIDIAAARSFPKWRNVANADEYFYGQAKAKSYYFGLGLSYNAF